MVMIISPTSISNRPLILPGLDEGRFARVATASVAAGFIVFVSFLYSYFARIFNAVQHAVIVTERRLYYIRFQPPCCILGRCGITLRVDCFRHNSDITYANVQSQRLSLFHRLVGGSSWNPGEVKMQNQYGVLNP